MSSTVDCLTEIPRVDWAELRDLYVKQKIQSSSFSMLQTFINWVEKCPELKIYVYALNDNWRNDGTFVVKQHTNIFCNTLSDDHDRLVRALNVLNNHFDSPYMLAGFPEHLVSAIERHFLDTGFALEDIHKEGTVWYNIPSEQVDKFIIEPPAGVSLGPLKQCHAEKVNNIWPHRSPGSIEFVELLISLNDNVGAFDQNNQLIAWCLQLPLGSLGLLQVDENHKRRGLGNLVVRNMAKKLRARNMEVMAPVVFKNVASRSMFEKLGGRVVDQVYWAMKPAPKKT